jgi:hypothetical protein
MLRLLRELNGSGAVCRRLLKAELDVFNQCPADFRFGLTGGLDPRITFTRASAGTCIGGDGLMRTVASNAPRFDHEPITGRPRGLLIEGQKTNFIAYSTPTGGQWSAFGAGAAGPAVTFNAAVAPDGTTTAAATTNAVTAAGQISALFSPVAAVTAGGHMASVYLKGPVGGETVTWGVSGAATVQQTVTLTNTWRRYILPSFSPTTGNLQLYVGPNLNAAGAATAHVWGAQVENGSGLYSSLIPTAGATATRVPDVAVLQSSTVAQLFPGIEFSAFTVFAEWSSDYVGGRGSPGTFVWNATTANNSYVAVAMTGNSTDSSFAKTIRIAGGAPDFLATYPPVNPGQVYRDAVIVQGSRCVVCSDGEKPVVYGADLADVPIAFGIGCQPLDFGSRLSGVISRISIWPRRLSVEALRTITQR